MALYEGYRRKTAAPAGFGRPINDLCDHCGKKESDDNAMQLVGTNPDQLTPVHDWCWPEWYKERTSGQGHPNADSSGLP
jgi:hypothetical protein